MMPHSEISDKKIALVTGANRGIGFEVCRQLAKNNCTVILTSRDSVLGEAAATTLQNENLDVIFCPLDVTNSGSIQNTFHDIQTTFNRLDILVNNAAVALDSKNSTAGNAFPSAFAVNGQFIKAAFDTNTLGPFLLCQTFIPLMKRNHYGRVVNVSSGRGQISRMQGGWPSYRISKAGLNAVTKIFASESSEANVLVNAVCPGWVKTAMGGAEAPRTVAEGAETIVWLATLPDGGPTGGFFRDKELIDW